MSKFSKQVYDILPRIPKGKVVTYSQIAQLIDNPKACRAVGNALHVNMDPINYPCYKVVNNKGELAKHYAFGIEKQKQFLQNDGIVVINNKIDLNKYQWRPQ